MFSSNLISFINTSRPVLRTSLLFFSFCLLLINPMQALQTSAISPKDSISIYGEKEDVQTSVFQLIQREDYASVTLKTNVKELLDNKKANKYQEATFSFEGTDGKAYTKTIKVKARGKSRRKICDFPPLKLKFSKEDLNSSGLAADFNKLKLVTHCGSSRLSQQNILRELLAYRIYNELTENSFRVQLIKVIYEDTKNKFAPIEKYGFIIESNDELATRIGGEITERYNCPETDLDKDLYRLHSIFQYMIGNTDWRLDIMHNLKIVQDGKEGKAKVIPYDFDFSGLVGAKYASPHPDYRDTIFSTKDRLYLGLCNTTEELTETLNIFKSKEKDILKLVADFELLSGKDRKNIVRFIKKFYDTIRDEQKVKEVFRVGCEE